MQKKCSRCGSSMSVMLRNVVYRNRVKIRNVPVHVCTDEECAYSQVVEGCKEELKQLMNDLGETPARQEIDFNQVSHFSDLLVLLSGPADEVLLTRAAEERVNELLDLFLLVQSLGDTQWMKEIRQRLTQLMQQSAN